MVGVVMVMVVVMVGVMVVEVTVNEPTTSVGRTPRREECRRRR